MQVVNDFYSLSEKATSGVMQENVADKKSEGDATDTPFKGVVVVSRMMPDQSDLRKMMSS